MNVLLRPSYSVAYWYFKHRNLLSCPPRRISTHDRRGYLFSLWSKRVWRHQKITFVSVRTFILMRCLVVTTKTMTATVCAALRRVQLLLHCFVIFHIGPSVYDFVRCPEIDRVTWSDNVCTILSLCAS